MREENFTSLETSKQLSEWGCEEWKDIQRYEAHYQVSSFGQVRRLYNPKNKKIYGHILKSSINKSSGYKGVLLSVNAKRKRFSVHRLVAMAFLENPENKPNVNHKDFDKFNNKVENLEWCTQKENAIHSVKNGHKCNNRGEKHGMSKLTEKQVLSIRQEIKTSSANALARKYKVASATIYGIWNRKKWGWLK